jgi:xanthine dehydrogenase YagS FAD-binding subunit
VKNFTYVKAARLEEAADMLRGSPEGQIIAGGTDLLPLMKEGILAPQVVVDISGCEGGKGISVQGDVVRIGALSSLSDIARHDEVNSSLRALAEACRLAASPQLRNMGTIGGNLLQQTRCWYYRGQFDCWLKGGSVCYARDGENEQQAIFNTEPGASPCVSAHPSDPAVALLALGASVQVLESGGVRRLPLDEFFALPTQQRRSFNTLPNGALLTAIEVPISSGDRRSTYVKAMSRAAWSFSLASVAVVIEINDGAISEGRVALGGVAPIPIRAQTAEQALSGCPIGDVEKDGFAEQLIAGARPLSRNSYKLALLKGVFKEALSNILD